MNAEVVDFGKVTDSSEPLTKVPSMRSGEFLNVLMLDVGFSRKQVFMLTVARKLAEGINNQSGTSSLFCSRGESRWEDSAQTHLHRILLRFHQPRGAHEAAAPLDIAPGVEGGHQPRRDDFGVRLSAAAVVGVPRGLEQIGHNAIKCGRVIDHRSPSTFVWRRSGGDFPLLSKNVTSLN